MAILRKSSAYKTGFQISLRFTLTQHSRDSKLIESLIEYLGCGEIYIRKGYLAVDFIVVKFDDLTHKIIPFFLKYPIKGIKSNDFEDFCKITEIMKEKGHLTMEGLEQIS